MDALTRSILFSLSAAAIAGTFGSALAWLLTRTELPGRRALSGLVSVPYALPPYLLGMAWVVLGNPTVGLLKDFLPAQGSYGFWGMTLVMASVAFAFPYLEMRAGFERLDPALEEAARMSGAGPLRVFRDVSLPLLWPALLNGMCLAFLFTLSAFGVPALLGLPVREPTLTTQIYSQLKLGGDAGMAEATRLSLHLMGIAVVALALSKAASRGAIGGGKASRPSLVRLGKARWLAALFAWGFFALTVVLPWVALGLSALAPVAGKFSPSLWTTRNLLYVLGLPDFREAVINSLVLAGGSATLITFGGFLLGFAAARRPHLAIGRASTWMIELLGIPFSTPGTVIAIVLITGASALGHAPFLLLAIGYLIKHAAVGARALTAAYRQVHPSLEEAARISGAGTWALLKTIWLPLLRSNLLAAWFLAFLPILTELNMSVLLTGPGAATLGTVLFQLQEYADQPSAAAMAWMLLTVALVIGLATRKESKE